MLTFNPPFKIEHNWTNLIELVKTTAKEFVHTDAYKESVLYEHGASIVSSLPNGGWISKSGPAHDFFVLGGIPETEAIQKAFEATFPTLSFTPATICYSSEDIPEHKDSPKNGKCSLVYTLQDCESFGTVRCVDEENKVVETKIYNTFNKERPVVLNIRCPHSVTIREERVWFSIHIHEDMETVKKEFDKVSTIVVQYTDSEAFASSLDKHSAATNEGEQ